MLHKVFVIIFVSILYQFLVMVVEPVVPGLELLVADMFENPYVAYKVI